MGAAALRALRWRHCNSSQEVLPPSCHRDSRCAGAEGLTDTGRGSPRVTRFGRQPPPLPSAHGPFAVPRLSPEDLPRHGAELQGSGSAVRTPRRGDSHVTAGAPREHRHLHRRSPTPSPTPLPLPAQLHNAPAPPSPNRVRRHHQSARAAPPTPGGGRTRGGRTVAARAGGAEERMRDHGAGAGRRLRGASPPPAA